MLVMANYAKHYASTIYESLLTFCLSFLESILSDLEESLGFLHLGLRWGKRKPWSNSLIIEDLVVSYISQVEIAVSSYLQVSLREGASFLVLCLSFSTHTSETAAILNCFARPPRVEVPFILIHRDRAI